MSNIRSIACERARMWAALLPDGELSQFERRILEVHLARCTDCARHAEQVAAIVAVVRDTPSEPLRGPVEVVRRPRFGWGRVGRIAVGGSAAAAVAAAALAVSVGTTLNHGRAQTETYPPVVIVSQSPDRADESDLWRQTQKARRANQLRTFSTRPYGSMLPDQLS
jgi:anti-sigma factor RsiW